METYKDGKLKGSPKLTMEEVMLAIQKEEPHHTFTKKHREAFEEAVEWLLTGKDLEDLSEKDLNTLATKLLSYQLLRFTETPHKCEEAAVYNRLLTSISDGGVLYRRKDPDKTFSFTSDSYFINKKIEKVYERCYVDLLLNRYKGEIYGTPLHRAEQALEWSTRAIVTANKEHLLEPYHYILALNELGKGSPLLVFKTFFPDVFGEE